MRRLVPEVDARLCDHRMDHGFVLDHSQLMADVLRDWIEANRKMSNNNINRGADDKATTGVCDVGKGISNGQDNVNGVVVTCE